MALLVIFSLLGGLASAYDHEVLNETLSQNFAQVLNPHYGLHVFATGKNGSLYHKYQTGYNRALDVANMTDWICLTPNKTQIWFGRTHSEHTSTDILTLPSLLQLYQTNPKDPLAWSKPRGPTCMCAAADPNDCPWCNNCTARPECSSQYYLDRATFPTSNMNLIRNLKGGLDLIYRGFDGRMYSVSQRIPGNSSKYTFTTTYDSIFE
eukprot:jgi/Bigna1/85448/estExt_fgenesh1_pg.C_40110